MKKVISLILMLLILLSAVNVFGAEEQEETIGLNFVTYKVKDGEAEVFWVNRDLKGKVEIPESVNGYPVVTIDEYAFNDCANITEVILPKSIQNIYGPGFRGCTNLEKINIPCRAIYSPIFQKNQKLKEVVLEENLNYLHHGAYSDCKIEKLIIKSENITISRKGEQKRPEPQTGAFTNTEIGTIYAHKGSDAEKYANEEGIAFVPLGEEITITINGAKIECDSKPYIKQDRTLVPMRAIFEALGASVSWDDATKTAIGVKDGIEVKITIGENVLYKNGEAIELDAPAEITNDRTMVPVRAISEAFGCTVNWDNDTKTVEITN